MPVKKSSKSAADECCAKCERDLAALRKEISALKTSLAKKSASGADPRVDKLIEALKLGQFGRWLEKVGLV